MDLKFNSELVAEYKSKSQIARVLTEDWVEENTFCPNCGQDKIIAFSNNNPFGDFFCDNCQENFELKSKINSFGRRVLDGAYHIIIEKILSRTNPNFCLLAYDNSSWTVRDFAIIPKHFFRAEMIIRNRTPLKRNKTYFMSSVDLSGVPDVGKIFLVKNSAVLDKRKILDEWNKTVFLRNQTNEAKGWTLDVLTCLDRIYKKEFTSDDVYEFESELKIKYPSNNTIKDQIRKQLQILRDRNIVEFVSPGRYRKIK
jgi:type II restriction enzyme